MSQPYLEWLDEKRQIHRIEIVDKVCIGRTCKGINLQKRVLIEDPQVSRNHAEIDWTGGRVQIIDNSRNGTWINAVRMMAGSSKYLSDGDTIRIADFMFRLSCKEAVKNADDKPITTELTEVSPVSEVVTTLVADMRGFTAYVQSNPSSDVHDMIKTIFDRFSKVIESNNGTVKDFAGDAIFAFWEHRFANVAIQSYSACRAAVTQMQTLSDLQTTFSGRYAGADMIQMGWGITTGPIIMSQFGARAADLAMVGDCVNLASRLSALANKEITENIIICSQTARAVGNRFALKDLGKFSIRGRKGKEHLYALLSA